MPEEVAVRVEKLSHRYGERTALSSVSFEVVAGTIHAFLGPNGGGKTTLFRVLSTLVAPQDGDVHICGFSLKHQLDAVRSRLGVAFQSPSIDRKLTVLENLSYQGALYGLHGSTLRQRTSEVLDQLGLRDRQHDFVEHLSGGLRRRVDLAKSLLHQPYILLLDEPSTGLDPGARSDLWLYLRQLQKEVGMTIVLTTHLLDEADRADEIAILHEGRLVAGGDPGTLRGEIGGETVTIECDAPHELRDVLNARWQCDAIVVDQDIRFASAGHRDWWNDLMREFQTHIKSIKIGRPTLEDVFIQKTGHRFWQADNEVSAPADSVRARIRS